MLAVDLLSILSLLSLAHAGCMTSKNQPCASVDLFREVNCGGSSGQSCESIPEGSCCGTDAEAFDSCENNLGQYSVGAAPQGNDMTNLCAAEVGRAAGCFSTPLNNVVGCYYTYSKSKRMERREQQPPAQACYKPTHEWKIVDGKKYMLKIERLEYDQYRNMTAGPEKDAFIMQHADKVVDVST